MSKVVAGVADAAAGQMVKQAKTATGWLKVAWIVGAAIAGAIGWLLGPGATQVQPAAVLPDSGVASPQVTNEVLPE